MAFATGFGLGLLVLPLTFLVAGVLGGGQAGVVVFGALTAGAMMVPPASGARAAGVLAGVVVAVCAGFAFLAILLSGATIG